MNKTCTTCGKEVSLAGGRIVFRDSKIPLLSPSQVYSLWDRPAIPPLNGGKPIYHFCGKECYELALR